MIFSFLRQNTLWECKGTFMYNYIFAFTFTAQKMKYSIKDFFSKCDQIRSFLLIWSHLLKKSLMENLKNLENTLQY